MNRFLKILSIVDQTTAKYIGLHIKTIKKVVSVISYCLLPITLAVVSILLSPNTDYYEELGSAALAILTFILFLTPIVDITNLKTLKLIRGFRREMGLSSFYLFLFHAAGFIYLYDLFNIGLYTDPKQHLFWAGVAAIGMLILAITSNNFSVKLLKRNWKKIQFIAIPTYFFALAHSYLADDESIIPAILIFAFYLVLRWIGRIFKKQRMKK